MCTVIILFVGHVFNLKSKIYYCFSESEEFDFIEKEVMLAYVETRNEKGVCEFEVVKYF